MVSFKQKKISDIETLGELFKKTREEKKLSLENISQKINVQKEHLENLEKSDFAFLPSETYTKNFVRLYSNVLNLNGDEMATRYLKEVSIYNKTKHNIISKLDSNPRFIFTPKSIKKLIVAAAAIICLVYLGLEVNKIVTPPILIIDEPPDNLVTNQLSIGIKGKTEKEVKVTINGQEILIDENGAFSENLNLKPGLNLIEISANKKHSQKSVVIRKVLVEQKTIIGLKN